MTGKSEALFSMSSSFELQYCWSSASVFGARPDNARSRAVEVLSAARLAGIEVANLTRTNEAVFWNLTVTNIAPDSLTFWPGARHTNFVGHK